MNWPVTIITIVGISFIIYMLRAWHNDTPKQSFNPFKEIPSDLPDLTLTEEMLTDYKRTYKKYKEHGEDISHENETDFKK